MQRTSDGQSHCLRSVARVPRTKPFFCSHNTPLNGASRHRKQLDLWSYTVPMAVGTPVLM